MKRMIVAAVLLAVSSNTGSAALPPSMPRPDEPLSLLTYNVHGLPWPVVADRSGDLERIGQRLAWMRQRGAQPSVVVVQEAFTSRAARIGRLGGYAYSAVGPASDERDTVAAAPAERLLAASASSLDGETEGKWEGSGLRLFSDFPILSVKRMAFPGGDCAGFDCLANKGVMLVTLDIPGKGPVQIATTHLNSRAASGVPDARSIIAYRRQVVLLGAFLRRNVDPERPLILAGDFNVGDAPGRRAAITAEVEGLKTALAGSAGEGLRSCIAARRVDRLGDAAYIVRRSRDFEFFYSGRTAALSAEQASIPFGREPDGSALSDHFGFVVNYRIG
jgi:endonuclease/exonuclease/phosphatase family metal-dependent hydrolase